MWSNRPYVRCGQCKKRMSPSLVAVCPLMNNLLVMDNMMQIVPSAFFSFPLLTSFEPRSSAMLFVPLLLIESV